MVWVKDCLKAIQDVKHGDEVLAWDPVSSGPVLKPVIATSSRMTQGDVYRLTLADAAGNSRPRS